MKKDKKKTTFRIYAKKLYLTYSQVDASLNSELVLGKLQEKKELPYLNYVISKARAYTFTCYCFLTKKPSKYT